MIQKNTSRAAAGWILAASAALSGCGGSSGTKPSAHIRAVDVATNTIDPAHNSDSGSVLVNGASSAIDFQYGSATPYQYVEAGSSSFQGKTTLTNPSVTITTSGTSTTSTPSAPTITRTLSDGQSYTAYLIGRRDVTNPVDANFTGFDYTHFLNVIVLPDNQPAPASGQANVRVLVAGPDIPAVDIHVGGTVPAAFANQTYNPVGTASANASIPAGATTFTVDAAGAANVIVPAATLNLSAGRNYTLIVTEPTGAAAPGNTPAVPPVATTYGLSLVQD